jgi:multidrug efflux pump subunit AcrA (membrane-fusion protein)
VRVVRDECRDCLVVPAASVVKDEDGADVIAVVADGRATQRAVRTGIREGDLVVVAGEGLAPGMEVVTEGAYGLPKETAVRVVAE